MLWKIAVPLNLANGEKERDCAKGNANFQHHQALAENDKMCPPSQRIDFGNYIHPDSSCPGCMVGGWLGLDGGGWLVDALAKGGRAHGGSGEGEAVMKIFAFVLHLAAFNELRRRRRRGGYAHYLLPLEFGERESMTR